MLLFWIPVFLFLREKILCAAMLLTVSVGLCVALGIELQSLSLRFFLFVSTLWMVMKGFQLALGLVSRISALHAT